MSLAAGTRLGAYEVSALLGVGGMGEVYRARDTRLDRTVAIKILPETLAADPQFRERFDREARTISQLDHPHICALYDVGQEHGASYIVMQYLEGETLEERLRKGALPADQALTIAIQVASALDAAHRAGIVHRDLKPGNVMLAKGGVKLLDFGLAKASASAVATAGLSMAPTMQTPVTAQGTILGTLQYMAPEQLEGRDADARTDIFAFGATLYEMFTGKKAFEGKSHASLIGAILKDQPEPVSSVQPVAPPLLDHIVLTCLAKDPVDRWQSAKDVQRQLEWVASHGEAAPPAVSRPRVNGRVVSGVAVAAGLLVAAGVAIATLSRPAATEAPGLKLSLLPPEGATFTSFYSAGTPHFALSPDGRRIAVVVSRPGRQPFLWIRSLDSSVAQELPATDDASGPFWSPDGESVGFFAQGKLKRMGLRESRPETLADANRDNGGAWSDTGDILFGGDGPLRRIRASGGPVETATRLIAKDAFAHRWPQFLPDGRHFLFTERTAAAATVTYLGELDSEQTAKICECRAVYAPPGFVLIPRGGRLLAQALDLSSWTLVGDPRPLLDQVGYAGGTTYPPATTSTTGLLAYFDGTPIISELLWFNRDGNRLAASQFSSANPNGHFDLSPDGQTIARTQTGDIWLIDPRGSTSRFSFGGGSYPIWSADGNRLLYRTNQGSLVRRVVTGVEKEQQIGSIALAADYPTGWSADGRLILLHTIGSADSWDLTTMSVEDGTRTLLLQTRANEIQGRLSANGRWLAYSSDESGRWEVYVQPFPLTGAKWQVSMDGGSQPVWRRDGQELFFLGADGRLMAVAIKTAGAFAADAPRALFQTRMHPNFAPFPFEYATTDGQRFLINSVEPGAGPTITVVSNWTAAVGR